MAIGSMQKPPRPPKPPTGNQILPKSKNLWGDVEDGEEDDLGFLLPPPVTIGPDENGIKKVVEYKINKDGKEVKVTTTTRIRTVTRSQLSKHALERRSWAKFGDAARDGIGSSFLTSISHEEIRLERPKAPGRKEETNPSTSTTKQQQSNADFKTCRNCRGNHWTATCPYRDKSLPSEDFNSKPPESAVAPTKGSYVPPNLRGGEVVKRRNEENSVRVSNLSEDTREADMHDLFGVFGPLSRVYVALDHATGTSRGFGFVNFVHKEDGERAIQKLNGFGYDNLILRVEWATPRPN